MGMDLDIPIRLNGRAVVPVEYGDPELLTADELTLLNEERGTLAAPLKQLHDRHHRLAKMLAEGKVDQNTCAIACGYTASTVSILKADPAFQDLIATYRKNVDFELVDRLALASGLSRDVIAELMTRMEDPELRSKMTTNQLLEIFKAMSDRSGMAPTTKQEVNVNVGLADRLQAARKRVQMIDITPERPE